ncbi:cys12, partial [Symbiodinium microadriaticum]
ANFRAHYHGTAPELWEQCQGSLDAFVMSAGTGGTLSGVGRFLKEKNADIRVCLADVTGSSLYYKVAKGVLYASEQQERSIRRHRTDTIAEGIGNDRLTANFAMGLSDHNGGAPGIDEAVRVSDQEALDMAHHLLRHEGLFLGSSAAVNCAAAVKIARKMSPQ